MDSAHLNSGEKLSPASCDLTSANRMKEREETDSQCSQVKVLSVEPLELECKICYSRYDATSRRPKVLQCQHRLCCKCLHRLLLQTGEELVVTCPFCRQETHVRHNQLWLMEEDTQILSLLIKDQFQRKTRIPTRIPVRTETGTGSGEVLLSPASLSDSDCLLVTVLDVTDDSTSSLSALSAICRPAGSAPCHLPQKCTAPRCLMGALSLVYCLSLPLGIYLLMTGRLWLGAVLVSLVPLTFLALVLYGFCQCLMCLVQEAVDAARRLRHGRHTPSP